MMKLWYHEIMRVFHDRLINSQDREYLKNLLVEQFSVFELEKENVLDAERIIFGDFMQGRDADPRFYC
jgi:dynein heavy chain